MLKQVFSFMLAAAVVLAPVQAMAAQVNCGHVTSLEDAVFDTACNADVYNVLSADLDCLSQTWLTQDMQWFSLEIHHDYVAATHVRVWIDESGDGVQWVPGTEITSLAGVATPDAIVVTHVTGAADGFFKFVYGGALAKYTRVRIVGTAATTDTLPNVQICTLMR